MLKLKPSAFKPHPIWFSRDPAFAVPVLPERGDASDEEFARATAAVTDEWERKVSQARETGDLTPILLEGQSPTLFTVAPMPRDPFRRVLDRVNMGRVGSAELASLCLRLCVTSVSNFGTYEVKRTIDDDLGPIATTDLVQQLDEVDPRIVGELGSWLYRRATATSPK